VAEAETHCLGSFCLVDAVIPTHDRARVLVAKRVVRAAGRQAYR